MNHYTTKHINDYSQEALERLANNHQLIDVRTRDGYLVGHMDDAILHQLDDINTFNLEKDKTYYVHCQSGKRSQKASEILTEKGYHIVNSDGGFKAFTASNAQDDIEETLEINNMELQPDRKRSNYSRMQYPGPMVTVNKEIKLPEYGK